MSITPEHLDWIVKIGGLLSLFAGLVGVWVTQKNRTSELEKDIEKTTKDLENTNKIVTALHSSYTELNATVTRHEDEIHAINTVHQSLSKDLNEIKVTLAEIKKDIQYLKK
jgi:septal ring factor EnvC (AmiA/AmiB activator)